jgi:hypothetical protein
MWKQIEINKQNIIYDAGSSCLIKMPNKSKYKDYKFWHPSKLIRSGNNDYARTLSYTDVFTFKLFKQDKNFKKIDDKEINAEELENAFECMENCTRAKSKESYLIVEEPEKIDKEVEVEESLRYEGSECTKDLTEKGYL